MDVGSGSFQERVRNAIEDRRLRAAMYEATTGIDAKRRRAWSELERIEELRDLAAGIKNHTLDHLDEMIDQLVGSLEKVGVHVHFASTALEANTAIVEIAKTRGCRLAAKGKSMTSEETGLNEALEAAGIRVVETDLGEYIVQLDHDRPSHITAPIVHKDLAAVSETFAREFGVPPTDDPRVLVAFARERLRDVYRTCDLGITGANFIVAESGTVVIVMNEGNGRFCTSLPATNVVLVGIEKVIPTLTDLSVFLKLLARSATGQKITIDTMMITGPRRTRAEAGPEELHVVLLDGGRTGILAGKFRDTLGCIRCGACLNICPVYRSIGGHAYGSVYPGPIGKLITPLLSGSKDDVNLSRASSLCGACFDVCPVKIEIPSMLVSMREERRSDGLSPKRRLRAILLRLLMKSIRSPRFYRFLQRQLRFWLTRCAEEGWVGERASAWWNRDWCRARRDLRAPAPVSFREMWQRGDLDGKGRDEPPIAG